MAPAFSVEQERRSSVQHEDGMVENEAYKMQKNVRTCVCVFLRENGYTVQSGIKNWDPEE